MLLLFNLLPQVLQYLHLFLLSLVFLFLFDVFLFLVLRATYQASFGQVQTLKLAFARQPLVHLLLLAFGEYPSACRSLFHFIGGGGIDGPEALVAASRHRLLLLHRLLRTTFFQDVARENK